MSMMSLGEHKWRILRRLLKHRRRATFAAARSWVRRDEQAFDELESMGLVRLAAPVPRPKTEGVSRGPWLYELTDAGVAAADMGEVDHTVYALAAGYYDGVAKMAAKKTRVDGRTNFPHGARPVKPTRATRRATAAKPR